VHRRPQQFAVAVLGHPARAGKVAVVDAARALTVSVRVEPEQDADDLRPLRTLVSCVEKADVEREVLAIVFGQAGTLRWLIGKRCGGRCARAVSLRGSVLIHGAFRSRLSAARIQCRRILGIGSSMTLLPVVSVVRPARTSTDARRRTPWLCRPKKARSLRPNADRYVAWERTAVVGGFMIEQN
jgi:hypothetical protein